MVGKIIKGIGGFYYVDTNEGVIECRARGRFRHEGIVPLVGDMAEIADNYVIDILPRKNSLIRPKVANVDKAVITFAAAKPKINAEILDKFLVLAAAEGVEAVICINKIDLAKGNTISKLKETYKNSGCDFLEVSAEKRIGIERLGKVLSGFTSVFAGPSGAGKSSIINLLSPGSNQKTDQVSKISRGKHTTRETVLIPLAGGGYVVDTPGFTSLSIEHIKLNKLSSYFYEFSRYVWECRFAGCSHISEPENECGVKMHVGREVNENRYNCYVRMYNELVEYEEKKYD